LNRKNWTQFVDEISKTNKNSTVSRVKFGLNIDTLTKEEKDIAAQNRQARMAQRKSGISMDDRY
jgi:hypothetical protein